jgi:protein tyrosine phosphatase (PTP) superfamily phosphohydrolase (DUF442 family)
VPVARVVPDGARRSDWRFPADFGTIPITMTAPVPTRSRYRRALVWGARVVCLLVVALIAERLVRIFALGNRHTVVEGRVYRCGQPSGDGLREMVRDKGIRTVINLRGTAPHLDEPRSAWYRDEVLATHELNISQEDVTLSARLLPPPAELRRLIEVFDRTEYPVLIHCKQGADRTGLASVIYLLLHTDATPGEARRQLLPWYGHVAAGPTAAIADFFDRYEAWLEREGATHTPERFRHWAANVYTPGVARSELEWLDPVPNPVPVGKAFAVRVRVTNRSTEDWQLTPGDYAGVHLSYVVANVRLEIVHRGIAGLMRRTVRPGESVELTLAVPPLKVPATYNLVAQMIDARGAGVPIRSNSFVKFGDESIMAAIEVK